jgi:hypothetical protein
MELEKEELVSTNIENEFKFEDTLIEESENIFYANITS